MKNIINIFYTLCLKIDTVSFLDSEEKKIFKEFLNKNYWDERIKKELGDANYGPKGTTLHISSSNAWTTGVCSALEALVVGCKALIKPASGDFEITELFIGELLACDLDGVLADKIEVLKISSGDVAALEAAYRGCSVLSVFGSNETISKIKSKLPSHVEVLGWGHKISFQYVSANKLKTITEEELDLLAKDCIDYEQQACSSPQTLFVDTDSQENLHDFSKKFFSRFKKLSEKTSFTVPKSPSDFAEISRVKRRYELGSLIDPFVLVQSSEDILVITDLKSELVSSPLFRTIHIRPLKKENISAVLNSYRHFLQTAGLLCEKDELTELSNIFSSLGVTRFTKAGSMTTTSAKEPHDGIRTLSRFVNFIHIDDTLYSKDFKTAPILSKEEFQNLPYSKPHSRLHFKSGGSSGEAKLSRFSYKDYHSQMAAAARGLEAAGLDSQNDRVMNLFFGSNLYGGLISFFTILEKLEAAQYPMGANTDYKEVVDLILKEEVNVLLGMPTYILNLFHAEEMHLQAHSPVKKIFYGGEHFTEEQKKYLQSFGVEVIRSAAYGSVDAGPIGYQCIHSTGSIHHLHDDVHSFEILEGRLIISTPQREAFDLLRYDVGDLVREIKEPCPCGDSNMRVELLGRHGDIFRAGTNFYHYQKIQRILDKVAGESGICQIHLNSNTSGDLLDILYSSENALKKNSQDFYDSLLDSYKDLNEAVCIDKTLTLNLSLLGVASGDASIKKSSSGKTIHVIDHRKEATL